MLLGIAAPITWASDITLSVITEDLRLRASGFAGFGPEIYGSKLGARDVMLWASH